MKKMVACILISTLLMQSLPVSVWALDKSDFSEIEEISDESVIDETVVNEQIPHNNEKPESSEQELEAGDSPVEESFQTETSSENQIDSKEYAPEKSIEEPQSFDSRSFTNSQMMNDVRYEWNWDFGTRSLDFNANDGNSQDAIQVMRDNNLTDVQHLILRNLSEATQSFQTLNNLVTIDFDNVSTIATAAFQDLTTLQEITFNDDINVQQRAFQGCKSLVKVNNSLAMTAILADAYNGTAIEELEVGVEWRAGLASPLSLNGMDSLRKLINHGGGAGNRHFLGALLPKLEVYEGRRYGADMFNSLVTFLNSMAPNLKVVRLSSNSASSGYEFDKLDLRNVPYLEEFSFEHSGSPGQNHALGANAFDGLANLRTVQFDGITGVSENAFRDTPNLEEVLLNRVNTIGDFAFMRTPSLKSSQLHD